ncbi:cation transporter [Streptococcus chenjunshii]|uniref:Cation transporter n=1 Tax=Streptococcus chenjunshii TaxID=2173853 RepID=A0A372KPX8_9STRE|nr:cation diffusion facilitator family transporter [Streptococcus chenjunshii]AXQ78754.1 cation transporter [Streptococcus chenjunshii]RFU51653.1 cation transporter [Streptococcus chenjunshii]RFU53974.1 cation transporter [Streptococcus chenjunshii]
MTEPGKNLKLAMRGPIISIVVYLLLTAFKLLAGYMLNSSALVADGFNNLSDILGNLVLLIGLYLASQPADADHRFGHWKIEDLASLITAFIMFAVGFRVLLQTVEKIFRDTQVKIDPLGALVGVISACIMYGVHLYNKKLSRKIRSSALVAASKDNLSDALTSLGTAVAIIAASLNLIIIDRIAAVIIAFFILKTAYDIFMESAFSLSDGFDEKQLKEYEKAILQIPKIAAVKSQRGRTYGSNIYLDIVLEMNPDLSVYESHAITEQVEKLLSQKYAIYDIDIHVEPAPLPEDEIADNVFKKLYKNEKVILARIPDYEEFIAEEFQMIDQNGKRIAKREFMNQNTYFSSHFQHFSLQSVSQKTKLVTYETDGQFHTSIWRRNEQWFLIFHQVTPKVYPKKYRLIKD